MNNNHLTETRFSNLELSDAILLGLKDAGFLQCTPIQDKTLPLALRGRDVAGQAQTGTGKTAAFLLAAFQHLINDGHVTDEEDIAPVAELDLLYFAIEDEGIGGIEIVRQPLPLRRARGFRLQGRWRLLRPIEADGLRCCGGGRRRERCRWS